jgi:hypothetical protein
LSLLPGSATNLTGKLSESLACTYPGGLREVAYKRKKQDKRSTIALALVPGGERRARAAIDARYREAERQQTASLEASYSQIDCLQGITVTEARIYIFADRPTLV